MSTISFVISAAGDEVEMEEIEILEGLYILFLFLGLIKCLMIFRYDLLRKNWLDLGY